MSESLIDELHSRNGRVIKRVLYDVHGAWQGSYYYEPRASCVRCRRDVAVMANGWLHRHHDEDNRPCRWAW